MHLTDCCLHCYQEIANSDWEQIAILENIWVFRCPHCKTIHTCLPDGTIQIKTT